MKFIITFCKLRKISIFKYLYKFKIYNSTKNKVRYKIFNIGVKKTN